MIYLIGGVRLAGKTLARKQLLERYKIAGIDLDSIRGMIHRTLPESGMDISGASLGDLSEKMWPWISNLVAERQLYDNDFYVLEGDYFTPETMMQFAGRPDCRVCFLLYSEISAKEKLFNTRLRNNLTHDWTRELDDIELEERIQGYVDRSSQYKKMCQLMDIEYFDTSENFEEKIEEAVQYLIGR